MPEQTVGVDLLITISVVRAHDEIIFVSLFVEYERNATTKSGVAVTSNEEIEDILDGELYCFYIRLLMICVHFNYIYSLNIRIWLWVEG